MQHAAELQHQLADLQKQIKQFEQKLHLKEIIPGYSKSVDSDKTGTFGSKRNTISQSRNDCGPLISTEQAVPLAHLGVHTQSVRSRRSSSKKRNRIPADYNPVRCSRSPRLLHKSNTQNKLTDSRRSSISRSRSAGKPRARSRSKSKTKHLLYMSDLPSHYVPVPSQAPIASNESQILRKYKNKC